MVISRNETVEVVYYYDLTIDDEYISKMTDYLKSHLINGEELPQITEHDIKLVLEDEVDEPYDHLLKTYLWGYPTYPQYQHESTLAEEIFNYVNPDIYDRVTDSDCIDTYNTITKYYGNDGKEMKD